MKLLYLVLDGVADRPQDGPTSLELASTPALDELARKAKGGMMYTIGRGIAPESDSAVLSILGYDPEKYYTGRGPLEALGAGVRIKEGYEVAFRANFATVDSKTKKIIDRRCGRDLTSEEARKLAESLNEMELGVPEAYVRIIPTIGHRAVVIVGHRTQKLSGNVSNTDPAYVKKGRISIAVKEYSNIIAECKPLDETPEARRTAYIVNVFTKRAIEVLDGHPVNLERQRRGKLKANAILLRDAGDSLPKVRTLNDIYKLSFSAIVEMPVEKGIARLLGMSIAEVSPPTGNRRKDYTERMEVTLDLLKRSDVVYVHLKGPDEPGHDGDRERKVRVIEDIDRYYVAPLLDNIDLSEVAILVTADHATPYTVRAHTDDPVPVILASERIEHDGLKAFNERECAKGSLGLIEHGWQLLPKVLKVLGLGVNA
ncbi:MAG: phosphonopyruvate decarboxylase [Thermoprotei archaeon]|nr:MAG: phosphonopyruvate decarboxylase [Thermoprotei archaeon]